MRPTFYLHIGLPKTGTTYLQREVFPGFSLVFLDKPRGASLQGVPSPEYGILDKFVHKDPVVWEDLGSALFDVLVGTGEPTRDVLLSDEGIGTAGRNPSVLRVHLERFQDLAEGRGFGAVRVLLSVRRQDQWLGSHYAQTSHRINGASQATFEAFVEGVLDGTLQHHGIRTLLDYNRLRGHVAAAVGPDNLFVSPYEQFARDPEDYVGSVLRFMGRTTKDVRRVGGGGAEKGRENARSDRDDRWVLRPRRRPGVPTIRLRPGRLWVGLGLPVEVPLSLPDRGRGRHIRMTDDLRRRVLGVYAGSNRSLAGATGLDLERYGYFGGEGESVVPCPLTRRDV